MARSCRPSRWWGALAVLLLCAGGGGAAAQDGGGAGDGGAGAGAGAGDAGVDDSEARYYAAVEVATAGDPAGAVKALIAIADQAPQAHFADHALMEAARLLERELGDLPAALALYQRVLATYPHARVSRLAGLRVEFLSKNIAGGAEPQRDYQAVLDGYADRPPAQSILLVEQLLAKYPAYTGADRATLWLGTQYGVVGREQQALDTLAQVIARWPTSEYAPQAWYAIGMLHQRAERWGRAAAAFAHMRDHGPAMAGAADAALEDLAKVRRWARLYLAALVAIALFLLVHGLLIVLPRGRAARPQWLPVEVLFYLPLGGLFALLAHTENPVIRRATTAIAIGGALVTWLVANALRCRPARRLWPLRAGAHGVAVIVAVLSIGYASIYSQGLELQRLVAETLQNGPEQH